MTASRQPRVTTDPGPATALAGAGGMIAGLAALPVAWFLARRVAELIGLGSLRIDDVVELGVVGLGAAAAAWWGLSCLLVLACLAARGAGTAWQGGERMVRAAAPQALRRALVLVVAGGVGLAGAGAAAASEAPAPAVATATTDDLGWPISSPAATPTSSPASGPATSPTSDPTASPAAAGTATPAGTAVTPAGTAAPSPAPQATSPISSDAPPAQVPTTSPPSDASPGPAPAPAAADATVVVQTGDCLWDLAREQLGPRASDADVATAWPRWYELNSGVIGADPDVLQPGQVLVVPEAGR